jgi:hypothetical protein
LDAGGNERTYGKTTAICMSSKPGLHVSHVLKYSHPRWQLAGFVA